MEREIDRNRWESFLKEFTDRHETKSTTLQVLNGTIIEAEEKGMSLTGVDIEMRGAHAPNLQFMFSGGDGRTGSHLTHTVPSVAKIVVVLDEKGLETGIVAESDVGDRARLYVS